MTRDGYLESSTRTGLGFVTALAVLHFLLHMATNGNYGEAGAIDYYGPRLGLPGAISGHNNYYHWGPGEGPVSTVISLGIPRPHLHTTFGHVKPAAKVISRYAMPYEGNLTVYVCSSPKVSLEQAWSEAKHYNWLSRAVAGDGWAEAAVTARPAYAPSWLVPLEKPLPAGQRRKINRNNRAFRHLLVACGHQPALRPRPCAG